MSASAASKMHTTFLRYLQQHPRQQIAAIVRCQQISPETERALQQAHLQIERPLHLIKAYAVRGTGKALLALAEEPWIRRIEPDQPVHTMPEDTP